MAYIRKEAARETCDPSLYLLDETTTGVRREIVQHLRNSRIAIPTDDHELVDFLESVGDHLIEHRMHRRLTNLNGRAYAVYFLAVDPRRKFSGNAVMMNCDLKEEDDSWLAQQSEQVVG